MKKRKVTIKCPTGLHARPASLLVNVASRYQSQITIEGERETRVNAKSIMGVLALGAVGGSQLLLIVEGPDEEEAIEELTELLESSFETS